jgi:hypothetical protein
MRAIHRTTCKISHAVRYIEQLPRIDRCAVEVDSQREVPGHLLEDLGRPLRPVLSLGGHGEQQVGDLDAVEQVGVEDDDEGGHRRRFVGYW